LTVGSGGGDDISTIVFSVVLKEVVGSRRVRSGFLSLVLSVDSNDSSRETEFSESLCRGHCKCCCRFDEGDAEGDMKSFSFLYLQEGGAGGEERSDEWKVVSYVGRQFVRGAKRRAEGIS